MFSVLESVAFDTGYAGSAGLVPQSWVNGNGTSYIYFGSGEFDGQGSGHDYFGTVSTIWNILSLINRTCLYLNLITENITLRKSFDAHTNSLLTQTILMEILCIYVSGIHVVKYLS